ncbi:unnamed protein product [Symbiodinium sp. CCMP2456]|nr:unnamed protein product [Symbiodinium sp. CCMP2456]
MKAALSELFKPGGKASTLEKCWCRCYFVMMLILVVSAVVFIVMGSMKDLTTSGEASDWALEWTFDSRGKGLLAIAIGCAISVCTILLCCSPLCFAQCENPELTHAWGQECSRCAKCVKAKCCCCCVICCNCFDYYCCRRRMQRGQSGAEADPGGERRDLYEQSQMPEMVQMGPQAAL